MEDVFPLQTGSKIILCSDGLYRQITEPRMAELLKDTSLTPELLVQKLCEEASRKEHSDNVTIVYVEIV